VDSPAGLVALAVLVVWLAYFVPSRLRHRQQVSTARTDDRFSARLRVLAISGGESLERAPGGECATGVQRTERLLTPPTGISAGRYRDERVQDVERSGISAARREHLARRQTAARRRALVTAVMMTLTVVTLVVGAVTPMSVLVALVPGALLATALVMGRRAALADQRADAELRHRDRVAERARASAVRTARASGARVVVRPAPVVKPRVTGRAVQASHLRTEIIGSAESLEAHARAMRESARSGGRAEKAAAPAATAASTAATAAASATSVPAAQAAADPTPASAAAEAAARASQRVSRGAAAAERLQRGVPRPTYTTKPAAPRWEPAPLSAEIERVARRLERWDEEDGVVTASDALAAELEVALEPVDGEADGEQGATTEASEHGASAGGLGAGLDGILDRRRAAGE